MRVRMLADFARTSGRAGSRENWKAALAGFACATIFAAADSPAAAADAPFGCWSLPRSATPLRAVQSTVWIEDLTQTEEKGAHIDFAVRLRGEKGRRVAFAYCRRDGGRFSCSWNYSAQVDVVADGAKLTIQPQPATKLTFESDGPEHDPGKTTAELSARDLSAMNFSRAPDAMCRK